MEVIDRSVEVVDASGVGEARRVAADLSRVARLSDTDAGRVALIVTEAASNVVKHGERGELLLRALDDERGRGIDVLVLDRGPGIRDLAAALRDGFSSAGTPGNGLGAIRRLASAFDVYSREGEGTVLFARVLSAEPAPAEDGVLIGVVNVPYPGEVVSGDGWAVHRSEQRLLVLVADGLGHGLAASDAVRAAAATFSGVTAARPAEVLERIHAELRATRGAAVAIAEVDRRARLIRFAGLGNIAGTIAADGATRSVVSHHGTAGHDARRIQEFSYAWPAGALLVLHSDGLTGRWSFDGHPGLAERHPQLVAALLYRDHRRGRDDATVLVLREER